MALVNLTPHAVVILKDGVPVLEVPASGTIARCKVSRMQISTLEVDGVSIPINKTVFGEVYDLPESNGDTFIVSRAVINAVREGGDNRGDIVSPDDTVRDSNGNIVGAQALAI